MKNDNAIGRDPHFCYGRYRLKKYRLAIVWIRQRYRAGESVASIARDWGVPKKAILAAINWRGGK